MYKTINLILLSFLLFVAPYTLQAQIGYGGIPQSFGYTTPPIRSTQTTKQLKVKLNTKRSQLLKEDSERETAGGLVRIATLLPTQLSLTKDGEKITLPNGTHIIRLSVSSSGAIALTLSYSNFLIPEGGKLYIYNNDKSQILGAYTHETNPQGGLFATEFIAGDAVVLEYEYPPHHPTLPIINIDGIGYGYNYLSVNTTTKAATTDMSCLVNINCAEGDHWQNEKRGVCKMIMLIGSNYYVCSGSLINNTNEDFTPYILSAYHCAINDKGAEATNENLKKWQFIFNYESESCSSQDIITPYLTLIGCTKRAVSPIKNGSDGLLLELESAIPDSINPYYNGWDRGNIPATSGVGIHHPAGSIKRISTYNEPPKNAQWKSAEIGIPNGHWNAKFVPTGDKFSITLGGSSGSPLFNSKKQIIGTLTGGNTNCYSPEGSSLYGKLFYHNETMNEFLDPQKTGTITLNGRYKITPTFAPRNLTCNWDLTNQKAQINWQEPALKPVTYTLYRNGIKIQSKITTTQFTDPLPPQSGPYYYQVTANYEGDKSSPFSQGAGILSTPLVAPTLLSFRKPDNNSLSIDWKSPLYEQEIRWGSGILSGINIGFKQLEPFIFAQQWSINDLLPLHEKNITNVSFYPIASAVYSLYIKQGDYVYTQPIGKISKTKEKKEITLTTPFVIDATRSLIIGIKVESYTESPAALDNSPIELSKGGLISFNNGESWNYLNEYENQSLHKNFLISATVNSIDGIIHPSLYTPIKKECVTNTNRIKYNTTITKAIIPNTNKSLHPVAFPTIIGYNIYRNGQQINTNPLNINSYTDKVDYNIPTSYNYQIEALYEGEKVKSENMTVSTIDDSFDTSLRSLQINETNIAIDNREIKDFYYTTACGITEAKITVEAAQNAIVSINNNHTHTIRYIFEERQYKTTIHITITSSDNRFSSQYQIHLTQLNPNLLVQRWDDVIAVVLNPENNGGLLIKNILWYKNNQLIEGFNGSYIQVNEIDRTKPYTARIITSQNEEILTCPIQISKTQSGSIIFPNPANKGTTITIIRNTETAAHLTLLDINGRIINEIDHCKRIISLTVPNQAGSYIIRIDQSTESEELKITVN